MTQIKSFESMCVYTLRTLSKWDQWKPNLWIMKWLKMNESVLTSGGRMGRGAAHRLSQIYAWMNYRTCVISVTASMNQPNKLGIKINFWTGPDQTRPDQTCPQCFRILRLFLDNSQSHWQGIIQVVATLTLQPNLFIPSVLSFFFLSNWALIGLEGRCSVLSDGDYWKQSIQRCHAHYSTR